MKSKVILILMSVVFNYTFVKADQVFIAEGGSGSVVGPGAMDRAMTNMSNRAAFICTNINPNFSARQLSQAQCYGFASRIMCQAQFTCTEQKRSMGNDCISQCVSRIHNYGRCVTQCGQW